MKKYFYILLIGLAAYGLNLYSEQQSDLACAGKKFCDSEWITTDIGTTLFLLIYFPVVGVIVFKDLRGKRLKDWDILIYIEAIIAFVVSAVAGFFFIESLLL